jgi:hypothetical protein
MYHKYSIKTNRLILITNKMAAGQRAIKFLQIAAGLWPVEKLANLLAYG